MSSHYSARITFANGIAAENVRVRMFDRDQPGQTDDDLTIQPGLSSPLGYFTVEYDASLARDQRLVTRTVPANPPFDWTPVSRTRLEEDPNDDFQPYLRFTYTVNGQEQSGTALMKSSKTEYHLPEVLEKQFLPSKHGFQFVNSFSGLFLPFALPTLPGIGNPTSVYGLCGGMSASALDFFLVNRTVPENQAIPQNGEPMQRFLYKRQLDSFGPLAEVIFRFIDWMGLPDDTPHGTQKRTQDEFEKIRSRLNRFTPVPIGLLYVKWTDTNQVWQNHQVLATGYTRDDQNRIQMRIYDPNYPTRDDVIIEGERVPLGNGIIGLRCRQRIGTAEKKLYGFFAIPYQAAIPPEDISY
jgi:hypothetical protein